jgi:hypothetical protein
MSQLSKIAHEPAAVALVAAGVALCVGVMGACLAFIVGWRQGTSTRIAAQASKISADAALLTANAAGNRAIAAMRLQWLDKLRNVMSEYHSVLVTYDDKDQSPDYRKACELGTQLDLMLNLNEADQKQLWDIADKVFHATKEERIALDKEFMSAGRVVLKNEWEKIKRELRS